MDDLRLRAALCRRILSVSALTSLQQNIMNFGILMVQSLLNSFAYSPAQDFGNGFTAFGKQPTWSESADGLTLTATVGGCPAVALTVDAEARTTGLEPHWMADLSLSMTLPARRWRSFSARPRPAADFSALKRAASE